VNFLLYQQEMLQNAIVSLYFSFVKALNSKLSSVLDITVTFSVIT